MSKKISSFPKGAKSVLFSFGGQYLNRKFKNLSTDEQNDVLSIAIEKLLKNQRFVEEISQNCGKPSVLNYFSKTLRSEGLRYISRKQAERRTQEAKRMISAGKPGIDPYQSALYEEFSEKRELLVDTFIQQYRSLQHLKFFCLRFDRNMKLEEISGLENSPVSTVASGIQAALKAIRSYLVVNGIAEPALARQFFYALFRALHRLLRREMEAVSNGRITA